jgi:hypothetical protein
MSDGIRLDRKIMANIYFLSMDYLLYTSGALGLCKTLQHTSSLSNSKMRPTHYKLDFSFINE